VSDPAISLEGIAKRYWKIEERSLLRSLVPMGENRSEMWALRDIDLRIEPGETIGMIGRNGAGKTTLLRLMAGVSQPTAGTVTVRGRVAPLLSVGVGFHPEMTGRENVYVNAMLLGLKRPEIDARFDEIVAFANLGEFIDTPVKFYSSGMFMRLGFSVAIHVDPDVLVVDEILAVGDVAFQLRCFDRMRELQRRGTTIVFVSHSMHAIQLLCTRTVFMHRGRVEFDGRTESAIARFHEQLAAEDEQDDAGAPVQVVHRELVRGDGTPVEDVQQGELLTYRTTLRFHEQVRGPQLAFRVIAQNGIVAYTMQTTIGDDWRSFAAGEEAGVEITFRARLGGGGTYRIALVVVADDREGDLLHDQNGPSFYVPPRFGVMGFADLDAAIEIDGVSRSEHQSMRLDRG
jgi:ABC-2 type transport system ATP-binding protein